jgi:hypothetical protein
MPGISWRIPAVGETSLATAYPNEPLFFVIKRVADLRGWVQIQLICTYLHPAYESVTLNYSVCLTRAYSSTSNPAHIIRFEGKIFSAELAYEFGLCTTDTFHRAPTAFMYFNIARSHPTASLAQLCRLLDTHHGQYQPSLLLDNLMSARDHLEDERKTLQELMASATTSTTTADPISEPAAKRLKMTNIEMATTLADGTIDDADASSILPLLIKAVNRCTEIAEKKGKCIICLTNMADCTYLTCMHMQTCFECSTQTKQKCCPVCRQPGEFKRTFTS